MMVTFVSSSHKNCTVNICKMYYVSFTKILQGGDTANGTVLHKKCCRTSG